MKSNLTNKILGRRVLEFFVAPLLVLLTGLFIEYKTNIFQTFATPKYNDTDNSQEKLRVDSLNRVVNNEIGRLLSENEGKGLKLEGKKLSSTSFDVAAFILVTRDYLKKSMKRKPSKIFNLKDSVYFYKFPLREIEYWTAGSEIGGATIFQNKFIRFGVLDDSISSLLTFAKSSNLNGDFPIKHVTVIINKKDKEARIQYTYYLTEKEHFVSNIDDAYNFFFDCKELWYKFYDEKL